MIPVWRQIREFSAEESSGIKWIFFDYLPEVAMDENRSWAELFELLFRNSLI